MLVPFDLTTVLHDDLVSADVLLERIERGTGARELLVAEVVASLSLHLAASDAVLAPAIEQHVPDGAGPAARIGARNQELAEHLTVIETSTGPEANAAAAAARLWIRDDLETLHEPAGSAGLLRTAIGDAAMIGLGQEFVAAKRHAPSRPHPNGNSAILRLVGVIDRLRDASSGRDILAATDGSGILSDESQDVVNALAELGRKPVDLLDPEQARRQPAVIDGVNRVLTRRDEDILPTALAHVLDTTISTDTGDLAVRIYDAAPDDTRQRPVVLYVHGGGWVTEDIYTADACPRGIAQLLDAVVVSVGYRLAPEHPFPAAHDDVASALRWMREHAESIGGDPATVAIVGEGAGANMAIAATVGAIRHRHPSPLALVLLCPVVSTDLDRPSCREQADAKPLSTATMRWAFGHLFAGGAPIDDRVDSRAVPDEVLAGMPPTLVVTAQRDPLHDEGVEFANRLKVLGVAAAIREYDGVPHGFPGMARVVAAGQDALVATAAVLHAAFSEATPADPDVRTRR